MLNQIVLVGRLTKEPEVKNVDDMKSVSNVTLAIPRSYKNADGEYETDFVDVTLWNGIAQNTAEYCKKGDLVGIKGRVQTDSYENDEGKRVSKLNVIAEKVTFLSQAKEAPAPAR